MKGVVLAGGFGTRLRPLTINLSKPMAPVANRPMMEHVVRLCVGNGVSDLLMMLHYSPDLIRRYFESGKNWNANISYLRPDVDLGTAGCIRFAAETPEGRFFHREPYMVISGDVLTDFELRRAWAFHNEKKAAVTIVLTRVKNPLAYGVVVTGEDGRIARFLEKPTWGEVFSDTVNTGIYILNPEITRLIPESQSFDFSKDLFPKLLEQNVPIYGYVAEGYWKDIGDLTEYRLAHVDILEGRVDIAPSGEALPDHAGVWAGENCQVEAGVRFSGTVILGKNVRIARGAEVAQSVIGDNVRIGSGASIRKSVVWDRSFIGPEVDIREAVIARSVRIGDRARVEVGAIVANRCEIGADAVLKPSVKMWPEKTLEEGAVLSTSLVWGERWNKQLFGYNSIIGLANIEITPEFAARLGAAYGAYLGPGAYVITSRDAHKASRLIKRALISGLLSSGVRVGDLRMVPVPVIRFEMGKEGEAGGVHVRVNPANARQIEIRFFDADGADLPVKKEKAIEQLFMREDFKRAAIGDVGDLSVPPRAQEYYRTGFLKNIDRDAFEDRKFKVVVDFSNSAASQILPDILGELGVEIVALNAHTSSKRVTRSDADVSRGLSELATIVTTLKADAGFLLDNGAEKLHMVDETGRVLSSEETMVLVGLLALHTDGYDILAYPVRGTSVLEKLATARGAAVLRTPVNPRHLLEYARRPNVGFVGDGDGRIIFSRFQPAFDAMFAVAKILGMLAKQNVSMSKYLGTLPAGIEVLHRRVPCPWGQKGRVMRLAQTESPGLRLELVDGVKIHKPDGWVLILPDGVEAYCHIWAEADTPEAARAHLDAYTRMVAVWQEMPDDSSNPDPARGEASPVPENA